MTSENPVAAFAARGDQVFSFTRLDFADAHPDLDYAADRIFLQKVGGGYIFIHRLLLEHFAALERKDDAGSSDETPK